MSSKQPTARNLLDKHVAVCVGTGGVGKTTTAAALALEAARSGRRALVLTVDPAKRLADALGAGELSGEPRPVAEDRRRELKIPDGGELSAMMLDTRHTFDQLVERFAPDDETAQSIRQNRIYAHLSDALAGSAEYAAMEQVYSVLERDEFDWIVVDTPPSQHALDFLEAPARMLEFLDSRLVHAMVHPAFAAGRFGLKLFQRGVHRALQLVERVSGVGFLQDLTEFLLAIESMSGGFKERARTVQTRLLGPETAFVLVAAPSPHAAAAAQRFLEQLDDTGASVDAIVVNRVHPWPGDEETMATLMEAEDGPQVKDALTKLGRALAKTGPKGTRAARAAVDTAIRYAAWVERDRATTQPLADEARTRNCVYCTVPELPGDVHDLDGLLHIADRIFDDASPDGRGTPRGDG